MGGEGKGEGDSEQLPALKRMAKGKEREEGGEEEEEGALDDDLGLFGFGKGRGRGTEQAVL